MWVVSRCVAESLAIRFTRDMEQIVNLHIERLPEGVYLATTEEIPGSLRKAGR